MKNVIKKRIIQTLILSIIPLGLFVCLYKIASAEDLSSLLRGRILLQVESHGEAWYINPVDSKRYFLGKPEDAFNLMRTLGLGVSNVDFAKFNGFSPRSLAGRILLKVQDKGQAYYVNPVNLKLYYLGRPADAFAVMRNLGLGITNSNLEKITAKIEPTLIGGQKDQYGCLSAAGYSWCPSTSKCQRMWEEYCLEYKEQYRGNQTATTTETKGESTTTDNVIATTTEPSTTATSSTNNTETSSTTNKFLANYFRNDNLIGDTVLSKYEDAINYDWGRSRGPDGVGRSTNFSARWIGNFIFDSAKYKFTATFDDGMNVYIDGEKIISSWRDNVITKTMDKEVDMTAGLHEIKVEYYKLTDFGVAKFNWEKI